MQFIKKAVRGLSMFFFVVLIFNLAVVTALIMTFNSPDKIEQSLNDSGVYNTFVSSALKEVQKSNEKDQSSGEATVPIDNPAIVAAANKAFTPELLQDTTEDVLEGTYDWLTGRTQTPNFTIDFVAAKQTFAQGVGDAAAERLNGLKVCTAKEAKALGSDIDAFAIACRPANLNVQLEKQKIVNQIATNKDFLGTPKLTPQTLPKDQDGKTVFENASQAPTVYKWVNSSPFLIGFLALISGLIALFLHESKRRGALNLAIATTVVGAILLLTNLGSKTAYNKLSQTDGQLGEAVQGSFQQTIIKAMDSISQSIGSIILWFGLAYLILGIVTLIIVRLTKPKGEVKQDASAAKAEKTSQPKPKAAPAAPAPPKPATKPAPKPTPRPRSSKPIQG